jgi:hypothetical protein
LHWAPTSGAVCRAGGQSSASSTLAEDAAEAELDLPLERELAELVVASARIEAGELLATHGGEETLRAFARRVSLSP